MHMHKNIEVSTLRGIYFCDYLSCAKHTFKSSKINQKKKRDVLWFNTGHFYGTATYKLAANHPMEAIFKLHVMQVHWSPLFVAGVNSSKFGFQGHTGAASTKQLVRQDIFKKTIAVMIWTQAYYIYQRYINQHQKSLMTTGILADM